MIRLYTYADSSDLEALEDKLLEAFTAFASSWGIDGILLTNRKSPVFEGRFDWNLGLRVQAEALRREDIDSLLLFLAQLSREVGLRFVVGTWDHQSRTTDLCFIDRLVPDGAVGEILEGLNAT
jgi:hypothetical protein